MRSQTSGGRNPDLAELTRHWGSADSVSLYLDRCQVETPESLVKATWRHVEDLRDIPGKVVDFGAGDGRFSRFGKFETYVGYEIDRRLWDGQTLPKSASLLNVCAFSEDIEDADLCIGNPPFVRNQDLPSGWRQHAAQVLKDKTGVSISGLANAWQYFFLLSLASTAPDGLCALVLPYEWVSRPSVESLRQYIRDQEWNVSVYRLVDSTFSSVLTTASITIVDKAESDGTWSYFEEKSDGTFSTLASPSGGAAGVLPYISRQSDLQDCPRAVRGLSPGTQKVLTLTEGERVRLGLKVGSDVVPCVTSLRQVPNDVDCLDLEAHKTYFRIKGQRCWLIRTDRPLSERLSGYLNSVPESEFQTATCLDREVWWKFEMPPVPDVLFAMSFRGSYPKAVANSIQARAVGGVYGIYGASTKQARQIVAGLDGADIRDRVVAHSNGLRKLEVSQLNHLLQRAFLPVKSR